MIRSLSAWPLFFGLAACAGALAEGESQFKKGRYAEAKERFSASERLYTDLGREEQASKASQYVAKAEKAQRADDLTGQARQALEAHDYGT